MSNKSTTRFTVVVNRKKYLVVRTNRTADTWAVINPNGLRFAFNSRSEAMDYTRRLQAA
jgi:hypothetical protein